MTLVKKISVQILVLASLFLPTWQSTTAQDFTKIREQLETIKLKKPSSGEHLLLVEQIINTHGWLSISHVGESANQALYQIVMDAEKAAIRTKYFHLLQASAENGESSLIHFAQMKDKILVENGLDQEYGTQTYVQDEKTARYAIRDCHEVNKRRKPLGLTKIKKRDLPCEPKDCGCS